VNEFRLSLKTLVSAHDKKDSLVTIVTSDKEYVDKVIIIAEPEYLGKFTTTPLVISYQRRFMNAVKGQK